MPKPKLNALYRNWLTVEYSLPITMRFNVRSLTKPQSIEALIKTSSKIHHCSSQTSGAMFINQLHLKTREWWIFFLFQICKTLRLAMRCDSATTWFISVDIEVLMLVLQCRNKSGSIPFSLQANRLSLARIFFCVLIFKSPCSTVSLFLSLDSS